MENSENQPNSLETKIQGKLEDLRKAVLDANKFLVDSFKIVDQNFEAIENRLNTMEEKIDSLAKNSSKEFESVGGQLTELKNEVIKIQKVSNYPEQYENLLKISK